ncbi:MAG: hypothetical protein ACK4G4_09495 [Thermus sp.]|uniref:hypothetical protein n=1 Tax=Thermus TaxID=270 RepID=UPI001FA9B81F|nr:hypothetical protein [Thermus neutrinimicus]
MAPLAKRLPPGTPLALGREERLGHEEGQLRARAGHSREPHLLLNRLLLLPFPLAGAKGRRLLHQMVRLKVAEGGSYPDPMVACGPAPEDPYPETHP